jgi:hypothetical protein
MHCVLQRQHQNLFAVATEAIKAAAYASSIRSQIIAEKSQTIHGSNERQQTYPVPRKKRRFFKNVGLSAKSVFESELLAKKPTAPA